MSVFNTIRQIPLNLLGIYNLDRRAEDEFRRMRQLIKRGGRFNMMRAKRIENKLQLKYMLKIPSSAIIGEHFQIRHPQGIRIGRTTVIGNNCKVFPYFCAIASVKGDNALEGKRRHPKIGDDCLLGSKATVIGPITIGDDVTIGACAIVTKDVPSHCVVKGLNQIRPKRLEEVPDKYKEEYCKFLQEKSRPLNNYE